jgi:hypothetical protein
MNKSVLLHACKTTVIIHISIYIKAKVSGWLCVWLDVFVCMLLGSGVLLLCSGGVFFGVRSGGNDIFDIYMTVAMQRGVFFGARSGFITWQRQLYKIEPFLWGLFWGCCLATTIGRWCFLFGPVAGQRSNNGVAFPEGARCFSSPQSPDLFWDPPSLLSRQYRGLFLGG